MSNKTQPGQAPALERRYQTDLRTAVQRHLANGFEITSRNPLSLRRGRATLTLQAGVLVEDLVEATRGIDISTT